MVQALGYIAVQPDWAIDVGAALGGPEDARAFWVSAYREGRPSIHASVRPTAVAGEAGAAQVRLDVEGGDVCAEYVGRRQLRLWSPALDIPRALYSAPRRTVACSRMERASGVRGFDVSRFGGLVVACGDNGAMDVYEAESGAHRVRLEGHLGDVVCCQFFPSGQVVLSGATDMRLKIWSATDGSNPVTLAGHTAAITDTAIVGVGKTVLSAARDGSVRLWNCGAASLVHAFELSAEPINAIHLPEDTAVAAAACEDGRVLLLDVDRREVVATFGAPHDTPKRAVAYDPANARLVAGLADGSVLVWACDAPEAPAQAFRRGPSAVSALRLVPQAAGAPLICVGTEDGQLFLASATASGVDIVEELVAYDVNPISQIRVTPAAATPEGDTARQSVWASGQDTRVCRF
ncbi:hypothetical protein IWQ57_002890 [Coemansia nantahalensis]|uniref:Uncharacterized protein n=1 Tax=Coemansia nantahalensis TaxID=2789366 RepID=A0ACC1JYD9_9FUNG|nr:hypothetical protein IWQ57_002890 [Coemansia nantahalensis]